MNPQSGFQSLDDLGSRHELRDGREIVHRIDSQFFEEGRRSSPHHRLTGPWVTTNLIDVAATLQRAQYTIGIDTANRRDLTT